MMDSPRIFRHFSILFHAPPLKRLNPESSPYLFFSGLRAAWWELLGWSDYSQPRGQWAHYWEPFMFYATFYIKMKWFFSVWWVGGPHYVNNAFPGSNLQLQDFKQNWNPMLDPKSSVFVVQKAAAPKSGVEFCQGSIGTISGSLATSYDVWRRRATSPKNKNALTN